MDNVAMASVQLTVLPIQHQFHDLQFVKKFDVNAICDLKIILHDVYYTYCSLKALH